MFYTETMNQPQETLGRPGIDRVCFVMAWLMVMPGLVRAQAPANAVNRPTTNSPIAELIADLDSTNLSLQFPAFDVIGQLGTNGKPAAPALIKALNNPAKRSLALTALMHLGPAAAEAIPQLIDALAARTMSGEINGRHYDNISRSGDSWPAANALVNIGPAALPALRDAAKSPDERTRIWAAFALLKAGEATNSEPMDVLMGELRFGSSLYQRDAVEAAGSLGPLGAPLVADLTALVPIPGFDQSEVIDALRRIGPSAASATTAIIAVLDSSNTLIRYRALDALNGISDAPPKSAIPLLIKSLTVSDPTRSLDYPIHSDAARALGKLGPDAREALPALIPMMNDPDTRVASDVIAAVAQIDASTPEAVTNAMKFLATGGRGPEWMSEQFLLKTEPKNLEVIHAFISFAQAHADLFEPRAFGPGSSFSTQPPSRAPQIWQGFFNKLGPDQAYALPDLEAFAKDSHPALQSLATGAITAIQKKP